VLDIRSRVLGPERTDSIWIRSPLDRIERPG